MAVTCSPVWASGGKMGAGHSIKIRATYRNVAPDTRGSVPCGRILPDARRIIQHGTFPDRLGHWGFDRFVGRNAIQYYGGHGDILRIQWLAEVGGVGDD